ncbi:MAG: DEAD/DEAH box helicase [Erysipelotrichaceae bacterium]
MKFEKFNNDFLITDFNLKDRELRRFKLLIMNFKNIEAIYYDNKVILKNKESSILIGNYILKIIEFFNKRNIYFEVTDEVFELAENIKKNEDNYHLVVNHLKELKSGCENDEGFKAFKLFCNDNLKIELRNYQYLAAYQLVIGNGGFNFSVPGSGKTIITYAFYNFLKYKHKIENVLIIGPKSASAAWYEEYITCFGIKPDFIDLSNSVYNECVFYLNSSEPNHFEITFLNYDKISKLEDSIKVFLKSGNAMIIIDEGHKVKNPNGERTKAIMNISPEVKYRVVLTGTPMPNGYEDLYSLMQIYSPFNKILPFNYEALKQMTKKENNLEKETKIMESISPFYSRVSKDYLLKTNQLELPIIHKIKTTMEFSQRQIYDYINGMCRDFYNEFEDNFSLTLQKALIVRKMQISANPALLKKSLVESLSEFKSLLMSNDVDDEVKISDDCLKSELIGIEKRINESLNSSIILNTVASFDNYDLFPQKNIEALKIVKDKVILGKKVIIWDIFVNNMENISLMLNNENIKNVVINGSIIGENRTNEINKFRNGDTSVMIASPATLAESISLHKSCQVAIYVNKNYNAAQFIQSKDRIHRINMPENTNAEYYFIENGDSIDEAISERLELKENRMLRILDSDVMVKGELESNENDSMNIEDIKKSILR